jgi:hypothetical protein
MKIKHKLLSDFQYISPDKKIFIIKAGTVLEAYNYKLKSDIIPIDREIVDANPEIFNIVDWKAELLTYIKVNKLPTPAVLTKKLIPFIEEIVLSNTSKSSQPVIDESKIKELETKEFDLNNRDRRIKDLEDEINIRLKRVEKRENEYKSDLNLLEKKDDELRDKSKELIEKSLDIDDKLQDINERERNLDRSALKSSKEIDSKYKELQDKIDKDLKSLSEKERDFELKVKSFSKREVDIEKYEDELNDNQKKFANKLYELNKFIGLNLDLNILIDDVNKMLN